MLSPGQRSPRKSPRAASQPVRPWGVSWWVVVGVRGIFSDGRTYAADHVGKPLQSTSGQGIKESSPAEEKLMS